VPILIVMATTNRGYISNGTGQSFIEFLFEARLRRLHAGLVRAETGGKTPADGGLRPRLHPDCVRRVQQDSGEQDVT